jgi:hypothetical protein
MEAKPKAAAKKAKLHSGPGSATPESKVTAPKAKLHGGPGSAKVGTPFFCLKSVRLSFVEQRINPNNFMFCREPELLC